MPNLSNLHRIRWIAAAAIILAVAAPTTAIRAQGVATPAQTSGTGPRVTTPFVPTRSTVPGQREAVRSTAATRDVTIHLTTVAVVLGIVILVILLL